MKGLTKNTYLLALTSLFADVSTEMLYPVLPIYLTQYLKTGGSVVGLVSGVAEAAQNIIQGASGWLADKLQKRKPLAVMGYTLSAMAKPLIGLATDWPGVLAARFTERLGSGMRSAPRDALIAASADDQNRGRAFGLEGIGDNLGAFLGPLLTIALLYWLYVDLRAIFYLAIIPGALAVIMMLLVKETPGGYVKKIAAGAAGKFPGKYWKYLGVTAMFGIGNSSNSFLILQTKNSGVTLEGTILIYALFNLISALISYPAGSWSDKFGRKKVMLAAFGIFFICYLGFALTQNIWLVAGLFGLYGLFQGVFRTVGKALAADLVPGELRASGIGWYSTTVGLSGLAASIIAGLLWDKVAHPAVFVYGAITAGLGIVSLNLLKLEK
jgi:MFS family permease